MNQSKAIDISVGLFMLAGIIAFIVLALKISGLTHEVWQPTYTVYARFENIGGLKIRSKVTIGGVTIGKVSAITFDPERYQAIVKMDIVKNIEDNAVNLPVDTSAAILTAGLLGEKYIGLSIGSEENYLQDGDTIKDTQSALILEEFVSRFLYRAIQSRSTTGNSSEKTESNSDNNQP